MNFYRPWTDVERLRAGAMYDGGASIQSIARLMERSYNSVRGVLSNRKRYASHSTAPAEYPRVAIPHSDVVDWYLAGWRFDCFSGGMCVFEWRESGAPRHPKPKVAETRELEAA